MVLMMSKGLRGVRVIVSRVMMGRGRTARESGGKSLDCMDRGKGGNTPAA